MSFLHQNITLQCGRYILKQLIGSGGFGNTYLAEQVSLGRKVAIKEFYMKEFCERDNNTSQVIVPTEGGKQIVDRYKNKFLKEARMIASLRNEHIIQIHDIFEEYGTAYYVMDYIEGGSLKDYVENNGHLSDKKACSYILQVADALKYLHSFNILHLDIKPSNILIDNNERLVLIDFGISKRYDSEGNQTSTTPAGISKGYAPIEQYQQGNISGFTPSTDIYSLGATLYFLLTGETPPEASIVYEEGLPSIINTFRISISETLLQSMAPRRKDRFQSINDFINSVSRNDELTNVSMLKPGDTTVLIDQKDGDTTVLLDLKDKEQFIDGKAILIAFIAVVSIIVLFTLIAILALS